MSVLYDIQRWMIGNIEEIVAFYSSSFFSALLRLYIILLQMQKNVMSPPFCYMYVLTKDVLKNDIDV